MTTQTRSSIYSYTAKVTAYDPVTKLVTLDTPVNLSQECQQQISDYKKTFGQNSNPLWVNTGLKCYPHYQGSDGYRNATSCVNGHATCTLYNCPYVRDNRHVPPQWDLSKCVIDVNKKEKYTEYEYNSSHYSSLKNTWREQDNYNL